VVDALGRRPPAGSAERNRECPVYILPFLHPAQLFSSSCSILKHVHYQVGHEKMVIENTRLARRMGRERDPNRGALPLQPGMRSPHQMYPSRGSFP
jgi:hypothetical protein